MKKVQKGEKCMLDGRKFRRGRNACWMKDGRRRLILGSFYHHNNNYDEKNEESSEDEEMHGG
jgi:hypothetical protein